MSFSLSDIRKIGSHHIACVSETTIQPSSGLWGVGVIASKVPALILFYGPEGLQIVSLRDAAEQECQNHIRHFAEFAGVPQNT